MRSLIAFCVGTAVVFAQGGGAIVGAGYSLIAPVAVAPGQVITVFVTGVGNVTQSVSAGNPPLPTTLAGISAVLMHGGVAIHAPLLAVFPFNACTPTNTPNCGPVTGVTLQVPFELVPNDPSWGPLTISDQSGHSASVLLDPEPDAIHVLRFPDTILAAGLAQRAGSGDTVVTHANGTPVSAAIPAQPREELVMWAVGLGATKTPVRTGVASPTPVPATLSFSLNFDYRPNAAPSGLLLTPWFERATPLFVGLAPVYVGLYSANFVVPPPPAGLPPCATSVVAAGSNPSVYVLSNLTVTLIGQASFDGAAICVATTP